MSETPKPTDQETEGPVPEVLKPQSEDAEEKPDSSTETLDKKPTRLRRVTYRPSHKATFIGAAVVLLILAINAAVIGYVLREQSSEEAVSREDVVISTEVLEGLGVSRTPIGSSGVELIVGPDAQFNGTMTVADNVSIGGELTLNSRFVASDASLANLEAGDTSVQEININGSGTVTNLTVRQDLGVAGTTRFQGPITSEQLVTINNNLNVSGNLAVGGILSARGFQASSLTSDSTLTIGGKIITRGAAPSVSPGPARGSNGTVSISGNDVAGTVAVNAGVGAGGGVLANVSFRNQYQTTPRVVITAIGRGVEGLYVSRNANGFSIGVTGGMSPGGYAFDYIVMQ